MSHDLATVFVSHSPGATGMINVAMGQQQQLDLDIRFQTLGDVLFHFRMISPASRIDKSRLIAEANEVDSRVRVISQSASTHLPKIFFDFLDHPAPLTIHMRTTTWFAVDHGDYKEAPKRSCATRNFSCVS